MLEAAYGGYLSCYSNEPNAARLTAGLGTTWETLNVGYKPHAPSPASTPRSTVWPRSCARETLRRRRRAGRTGLSPMTHVHCAWDLQGQGVTAAQMNLYYGLAVTALDGMAFTEQSKTYTAQRSGDLRFHFTRQRVCRSGNRKMGAPFRHAARVKVTAKDGRSVEKLLHHRRGSPENPLKPEEIQYKFRRRERLRCRNRHRQAGEARRDTGHSDNTINSHPRRTGCTNL